MINNIEVLNGSMDKLFQKDIFEYNVYVPFTAFSLDLIIDAKSLVTVYGNDNIANEGKVFIEVFDNNTITYTLNIFKEEEQLVSTISSPEMVEISLKKQILNDISTPLVFTICFFLMVFTFCLIFKVKREK